MPTSTGKTNQQYLISTICITMALINTHKSNKKYSQISQIHIQNLLQTQTHNLKSPIQPIILSPSHNKQTLNTEQKVIFQPQNLPNYSPKKPTHVFNSRRLSLAKTYIYKTSILFLNGQEIPNYFFIKKIQIKTN